MVTKEQALASDTYHYGTCTRTIGKRGGVTERIIIYRRNGATQTWKTRLDDFRVPVKHGMSDYGEITPTTAPVFHIPEECPIVTGITTHDAFIQKRYLMHKMSEAPEFYRFCCSCGITGTDHFREVDALTELAFHKNKVG